MIVVSLVVSCQREAGPALAILDVQILAPLPGSNAAVAYFSLVNNGDTRIIVERVSSPQFQSVEIHETTIDDGIARMAKLEQTAIDPGRPVEFRSGGKHLMLMQARDSTAPGTTVTLEFHYATDGMTVISAQLQSRMAIN